MKTRTIVLNSRPNAKHGWPASGRLCIIQTNGSTRHCCIGCEGLTHGIEPEFMEGYEFPTDTHQREQRFSDEWADLWVTEVPKEVDQKLREALGELEDLISTYNESAQDYASAINDDIAVHLEATEAAVDALRILFRWLGSTVNEKWVIRWLQ